MTEWHVHTTPKSTWVAVCPACRIALEEEFQGDIDRLIAAHECRVVDVDALVWRRP